MDSIISWAATAACAAGLAFWGTRHHRQQAGTQHEDEDIELYLSPRTGGMLAPPRLLPAPADVTRNPVSRQLTTAHEECVDPEPSKRTVHTQSLPAAPQIDAPRRAALLSRAVRDRDVELLAAQASADPAAALAAWILAADIGAADADPRTALWRRAAFSLGTEPTDDACLAPYLPQVRLQIEVPDWGVALNEPVNRQSLGLAVAGDEWSAGDLEGAYATLLDLPDTPVVCVLRGICCLQLRWWSRAARVAAAVPGDDPFAGVLHAVAGVAAAESGDDAQALRHLDLACTPEPTSPVADPRMWRAHALLARAGVRRRQGDDTGAWADLTDLLAMRPDFPGARQALKDL